MDASKEVVLEVNTDKTKNNMLTFRHQIAGQKYSQNDN
jgi:hypothetical protein